MQTLLVYYGANVVIVWQAFVAFTSLLASFRLHDVQCTGTSAVLCYYLILGAQMLYIELYVCV